MDRIFLTPIDLTEILDPDCTEIRLICRIIDDHIKGVSIFVRAGSRCGSWVPTTPLEVSLVQALLFRIAATCRCDPRTDISSQSEIVQFLREGLEVWGKSVK